MSNRDSTVAYGSDDRPDVAQDEALAAVEQAISGATVVSAVARIGEGGKIVRCNMQAGTASGNSNAVYFLVELATVGAPLLAELTTSELDEIRLNTAGHLAENNGNPDGQTISS